MSTQPAPRYKNNRDEEFARWRRRDHANIEAMENLMIAFIAETTGAEMPPKVRSVISALQGAHGGGEVAFEEFERDYLSLGNQLHFTGTDEAIRARVRAHLDAYQEWMDAAGYLTHKIKKGGQVVAHDAGGSPIRQRTIFIDYLKPYADEAVQRARESERWKGSKEKKIKAHPGLALADQAAWAVAQLTCIERPRAPEGDGAATKTHVTVPLDRYEQSQESRIEQSAESVAEEIERRGGDGAEWVERLSVNLARLAASLKRTERARRDMGALAAFDGDAQPKTPASYGSTYMCEDFAESADALTPPLCYENPPQSPVLLPVKTQISEVENEKSMLDWALEWAAQGVPVFPLHTPTDAGACSCAAGANCKSTGKHPRTANGLKDATTDPAQIKNLWRRYPTANIGGATGEASGFFALDEDPKAGGSASLADLVEANGDDWLNTSRVKTGSGGFHFYFLMPESTDIRNTASKIAPGLDTRGTGGYVCLSPSLHASGNLYRIENDLAIAPAPAWLVEMITATPEQPASQVIDFQDRRDRRTGGGATIGAGERNDRLFRIACAIWGKGQARDMTELHAQMSEVNVERCNPPLDAGELTMLVTGVATRYPRGVPIPESEKYEPQATEEFVL
jgi:putative DNA primase/helicase